MSMLTCLSAWTPNSSQNNETQTNNDLWMGSTAGVTLGNFRIFFISVENNT